MPPRYTFPGGVGKRSRPARDRRPRLETLLQAFYRVPELQFLLLAGYTDRHTLTGRLLSVSVCLSNSQPADSAVLAPR